jgi:hypothetical protein
LACPARFERATYALEGRCSIQLSYRQYVCTGTDVKQVRKVVGVQGFEPWTPCSQSRCATRLRYTPTEPIFYTESAISGKSCKIRAMIAYFSSRLHQRASALIALVLLTICLQGTHWAGFAHSISHASTLQQSLDQDPTPGPASSLCHSSDSCHLYDALSLAGFAPGTVIGFTNQVIASLNFIGRPLTAPFLAPVYAYLAQAPPNFIL